MRRVAWWVAMALATSAVAVASDGPAKDATGPRMLVLALDGVPFRVVEQAREQGAFAGWPPTSLLVSTFPSVTNVAFTAMFQPFDVEPARGYEVQFYDSEHDRVVGGSLFGYSDRLFAWRDTFDVTGTTVGGKLSVYAQPHKKAIKEFEKAERLVLETDQEFILAHVGSSDAMMHLRGDEAVTRLVIEIDDRIAQLKRLYRETFGCELRVILLSDHGNTRAKIHSVHGLRKTLKRAGLRPSARLEFSNDIIAATFGIVNFGTLITDPANAEIAARAIAGHEHVALAAWISGEHQISIVSHDGVAHLRWIDSGDGPRFAYVEAGGDPLRLAEVVVALEKDGQLDSNGFASGEAWLRFSGRSDYPDAPQRLVNGLTGAFVANRGTVLFSMDDGHAWGWKSAYAGSWIWGGPIEGTHGGLDRDSSSGFYLADDPRWTGDPVMSVRTVFEGFEDLERCRQTDPTRVADSPTDDEPQHDEGAGSSHAP